MDFKGIKTYYSNYFSHFSHLASWDIFRDVKLYKNNEKEQEISDGIVVAPPPVTRKTRVQFPD